MGYLIFIIIYFFGCYLIWRIAKKMSVGPYWMAWIPFANDYLVCRMAGKHFGWWILFYIPVVNIYVAYVFWRQILIKFKKPGWLALLMLVPGINFLMLLLLVFVFKYKKKEDKKEKEESEAQSQEEKAVKDDSGKEASRPQEVSKEEAKENKEEDSDSKN